MSFLVVKLTSGTSPNSKGVGNGRLVRRIKHVPLQALWWATATAVAIARALEVSSLIMRRADQVIWTLSWAVQVMN